MVGDKPILVGRFGAAHGVRGEIRLKSFTEDPEQIAGYRTLHLGSGAPVRLISVRAQGTMLVVGVEGVSDRDGAQALNGAELFIDRSELAEPEEDEFYHADLIGLEARSPDGGVIGTVAAVHDFGAGDILEIKPATGPAILIAFARRTVPQIDLGGGFLVADLPAETQAEGEGT